MALGQQPHLPARLAHRALPAKFFSKLLKGTSRLVKAMERVLRPRLLFLHEVAIFRRVAGAVIALSGCLILLPVPLPLSNFLPASAVMLLSAAALERDGLFFLAGLAMFCVALAYFILLPLGGIQLITGMLPSL